ncbi:MAG TPA: hypothetical protein VGB64_16010 [Actinomycetota bacterium]
MLRARLLVALFCFTLLSSLPSGAVTGTQRWAIVLCNFSNHTATPNSISYYQRMFSDAGVGETNVLEYWRDVSYGRVSVSGTVVTGWHTLSQTRDQWVALNRYDKIEVCSDKAAVDGFNFSGIYGVVVIFPEAVSTTTAAIDASQTTVTVNSAASFPPAPPFLMVINDFTADNAETVNVTGISGDTFTITRGFMGTTPRAHNMGATAIAPGDFGNWGPGPVGMNLNGTNYNLGMVIGPDHYNLTGVAHEMGHGFGYFHTRKLSTSTTDYNDCWDLMSAFTCVYTFNNVGTNFGGSNLGSRFAAKGPGLTAHLLDIQGWMDSARVRSFDNSSCTQSTVQMAALNHAEATGRLEVRIPATVTIPGPESSSTTSDYYTVELRSQTGWDQGVPRDAFILHLKGQDNYAYWVDGATDDGALVPGEEFVNAAENTYVAVNSLTSSSFTGLVTVAGCKINTVLSLVGATEGDYTDSALLSADLKVAGSLAPVPSAPVTLSVGTQSCSGTTNATGRASCSITLNQTPGVKTRTASYAGEPAYNPASVTGSFTIDREDTLLTYNGPLTSDYNDVFTASARLRDADSFAGVGGRTVSMALGVVDACSAATDSGGTAACSITPSQPAGIVTLVSDFAGDAFFKPSSDSDAFEITHQETTTVYNGPTVIANDNPVTLSGQLLEEGVTPIAGRTLTLGLGAQTCTSSPTDAAGVGTCVITPNVLTLGEIPLSAVFAGDAYYEPSADESQVAIVFAFLDQGAFTLGDLTADAATPTTSVSWWHDEWYLQNSLSGGAAPASFKGFARDQSDAPPACGTTWTTRPGNNSTPPATVPTYMGTVVSSEVTKSGSVIESNIVKIVVVRTDLGYAPNPGAAGTGAIVATYC